jgi:hypothetical protein
MKKLIICALFLLAGCASTVMNNFVNRPVSDVMVENGPPSYSFDTGPNQKTFIWKIIRSSNEPGVIETSHNAGGFGNDPSTTTTVQLPQQQDYDCYYAFYTQKTNGTGQYLSDWIVTGFKKPNLSCQALY